MIYLSGSRTGIREHLDAGRMGLLNTPASNFTVKPGWIWAADNGCFNSTTYCGDEAWLKWLERQPRKGCLFAVAPDVMGDHLATLERSAPWLPKIRALGYPAALVAQDGLTIEETPWGTFDVLFIGGTNKFKLEESTPLIRHAVKIGVPVHVGRVNSMIRYRHFAQMGVATADGTYIAFGPKKNVPDVLWWREHFEANPTLELDWWA